MSAPPVLEYSPSRMFPSDPNGASQRDRLIIAVKKATYNDKGMLESATFVTAPNTFFGRTLQAALGVVSRRNQTFKDFIRAKYSSAVHDAIFEDSTIPFVSFNVAEASRYDAMPSTLHSDLCSFTITEKLEKLSSALKKAKTQEEIDTALGMEKEISDSIDEYRKKLEAFSHDSPLPLSPNQRDKLINRLRNYLTDCSFKLNRFYSEGKIEKKNLTLSSALKPHNGATPQQEAAQFDEIVTAYHDLDIERNQLIAGSRDVPNNCPPQSRSEFFQSADCQKRRQRGTLNAVAEALFKGSLKLTANADAAHTAWLSESNPEKKEALKKEALFLAEKAEEAWSQTIFHFDHLVTLLHNDSLDHRPASLKKEKAERALTEWTEKAKQWYGESFSPLTIATAIATPTPVTIATFEKQEVADSLPDAEVSATPTSSNISTLPTATFIETTIAQRADDFSHLSDASAARQRQVRRITSSRAQGTSVPSVYKTPPDSLSSPTASAS